MQKSLDFFRGTWKLESKKNGPARAIFILKICIEFF